MCIFTGAVDRVKGTRIFARSDKGWQYLAYDLDFAAREETAMLLPLPVPPGGSSQALQFISLESYPEFFDDLKSAFWVEGEMGRAAAAGRGDVLAVQSVGAFEASYVPSVEDFARLDSRFRLSGDVWESLPGYRDYGFAVFKLKPGAHRIHPMAFRFQTREKDALFFPTVHVHARRFESWAHFDHSLFAQGHLAMNRDWVMSTAPLGKKMRGDAHGLVAPGESGYRRILLGTLENRDTRLALEAP